MKLTSKRAAFVLLLPLLSLACQSTSSSDATVLAEFRNDQEIGLPVFGMSCPKCANNITHQLFDLEGVTTVDVNMSQGFVTVQAEPDAMEEIEKLKEFVRRHHHGQKHAQAEDRRKKLERIESVPKPRIISVPPMQFVPPPHCGEIVARSERLGHGFDRPLFGDLTFDVLRGEKWGILGSNGTGKTTLLKCFAGQLDPKQGRMIQGAGVQPAYFDQHLSGLSLEDEAIEAVRTGVQRQTSFVPLGLG
jgi:ABC-type multidrug transport system fused ATPase/permease subunit